MPKQIHLLFVALLVVGQSALANPLANFACPLNQTIKEGLNQRFKAREKGVDRVFYAEFPNVAKDKPVGVIFSWHGVGASLDEWRRGVNFAQHSSADFPFIVISPHDTGLTAVFGGRPGLSWDLFKSHHGDDNLEAALFESILGCLSRTHEIDSSRIYSAGFSGVAIVSNMLHARYPKLISAIFSGSGTWMNDSAQRDTIRVPFGVSIDMDWSPLEKEDHGAVLMTYGSDSDTFGFLGYEIINFNQVGAYAKDYLRKHNRTAVVCEHDGGHHFHPAIRLADIVKFFRAHEAGKPSPIKTSADLPRAMVSSCEVIKP